MIRVLLLCRYDRRGASSRLRFLQYICPLKERGISIKSTHFFDSRYLPAIYEAQKISLVSLLVSYSKRISWLVATGHYDLLWIERELLPFLPAWFEKQIMRSAPYVLDMDDASFYRYNSHRYLAVRALLGGKIEILARGAATVVVGNQSLAAWAKNCGARHIEYIPTAADDRVDPPRCPKRAGQFTIGWLGSPATEKHLLSISNALRHVCSTQGTRLRLVGATEGFQIGIPCEMRPWSECAEAEEVAEFDVGVAPLSDGLWERGKSGFKIIRYMAASLPVVASPVGENASIVRHGETGFLAKSTHEWVEALERLRKDPSLRHSMGQAGRALAEERYSTTANIDRLANILIRSSRGPGDPSVG